MSTKRPEQVLDLSGVLKHLNFISIKQVKLWQLKTESNSEVVGRKAKNTKVITFVYLLIIV